jgi:hypothetical protein
MAHLYAYPENYYNSPAQAEENQEFESAHADSHVFPLLCLPDKATKEVLKFMHASQVVQFNMTCKQLCSESQSETYKCVKNLKHVVDLVRKYETRVFEDNESNVSWTAYQTPYRHEQDSESDHEPSYSYRSSDFASLGYRDDKANV